MVISWIIESIDNDHVYHFYDYTTTTLYLLTRIQNFLQIVSLPPMNGATATTQCEVARGRNRDKGEIKRDKKKWGIGAKLEEASSTHKLESAQNYDHIH